MAETWQDATEAGAAGGTFGSLAAITVQARNARIEADGPLAIKPSFFPRADGSFRILVAAPRWAGRIAAKAAGETLAQMKDDSPEQHKKSWNDFWNHVGLFKMASADGLAEYIENLRLLDLYLAASEERGRFPGSQAGVGDLFSSLRDFHKWSPSAYWHWNLRMQVAADIGAGAYELNAPYFRLYRDNLKNIELWTRAHMQDRPGICVPETMRFNGAGFENEAGEKPALDCDAGSKPYYNARTLTTGAEVSLWIWRQYLATQDAGFLAANYPVMADSAFPACLRDRGTRW